MSPRCFVAHLIFLAFPVALWADLAIQIGVNPGTGRIPISPYVYGTDQDLPGVTTPGSRRMGGDRMTGYNWETNASNAGTDYLNESDNYMVSQLPAGQQSTPAIALTAFHDQSLAIGTPYTILTLQMAGFVAADENGPVTAAQAAPSSRWVLVQNDKPGGAYSYAPNLTDGTAYMDELLNYLLNRYGPASGKTGVKGYNLDNEPSLWPSTHPYLHPAQTTCAELATKSAALAKTIKHMDPTAEVLGGVFYGSEAYFTFQNAPDWPALQASSGYRWFIDWFLDQMNRASATAGMRLLDVLDLHRYSDENVGGPTAGTAITNQTDFSDTKTNMDRVQAPRVLWDPTYVENSWVQTYDSQFLPWIPNIQASISARYPGTRLSFSEYNYGGESDISGGLAQADVLGIYGKYGVYLGCVWILHGTPPPVYTAAAFNLFLNYDGKGGRFGGTAVSETDSDTVNSSAYASVDSAGALHVVVLNKNFTQSANFTFQIAGAASYASAKVYAFGSSGPAITARADATVAGNQLSYSLPPLTAAHFVFQSASSATPQFTTEPVSQTLATGTTVAFSAVATGGSATGYQWLLNGNPLVDGFGVSGATSRELVVNGATSAAAGSYTCVATNSGGSTTSSAAVLNVINTSAPGRLINISTRAFVGTGGNVLIAGFVAKGGGSKTLLLRAAGPALADFGVAATVIAPVLSLYDGAGAPNLVTADAGWQNPPSVPTGAWAGAAVPGDATQADFTKVGAFALVPGALDSAIKITLPSGAYTAQVAGISGGTGVALAEVYDADTGSPATQLINISSRALVGTGGNILIAGFVISGSTSRTVLVRASGPALTAFGVAGALPDPQLMLYDSGQNLIASNQGWGGDPEISGAASAVGAFAWNSPSSADSAILITLPPGAFTAQVSGASRDTGVSLAEVYVVP
jgi:hypothetical protein